VTDVKLFLYIFYIFIYMYNGFYKMNALLALQATMIGLI